MRIWQYAERCLTVLHFSERIKFFKAAKRKGAVDERAFA